MEQSATQEGRERESPQRILRKTSRVLRKIMCSQPPSSSPSSPKNTSSNKTACQQHVVTAESSAAEDETIFLSQKKRAKLHVLADSSDSEDGQDTQVQDRSGNKQEDVVSSVYQAAPIKGFFCDEEKLNAYIDDVIEELNMKRPESLPIFRDAADIKGIRVKLNKIPKKSTHFCQFSYKMPIRLAVVTNLYGTFVNTYDDFSERKKIFDMAHLEAKHRLSMLVSSSDYWWHEPSKQLMRTFFEDKLVHDLKAISSKDVFTEAINKFRITNPAQAWKNLMQKILTAKKPNNKGVMSPGVWNIKVLNTQTMPSTIPIQLVEFKKDALKFSKGKWKNLVLEPKYIHGLAVIAISGFKLTRSGLSLDTELEFLSYSNVPQELTDEGSSRQTPVKKNFISCSKWAAADQDSSDDDGDVATTSRVDYGFVV